MTVTTRKTFCRICEAFCGLELDVEDGRCATSTSRQGNGDRAATGETIIAVRADPDHPVSRGFACIKGTSFAGIHHDPERLNYPMKRVNGRFERIGWDQAIVEIASRVRAGRGGGLVRVGTGRGGEFSRQANIRHWLKKKKKKTHLGFVV